MSQANSRSPAPAKKRQLKPEQLEDIRKAFQCFDHDGGGTIDSEEMARVLSTLGHHSEEEVLRLVREADENGDDEIDFEEFVDFIVTHMPKKINPFKEMEDAFQIFDHYGNGSLDAGEMQLALHILGKDISLDDAQAIVDAGDTTDEGEITYEEFKTMLLKA